jgi:hypothetical protein
VGFVEVETFSTLFDLTLQYDFVWVLMRLRGDFDG